VARSQCEKNMSHLLTPNSRVNNLPHNKASSSTEDPKAELPVNPKSSRPCKCQTCTECHFSAVYNMEVLSARTTISLKPRMIFSWITIASDVSKCEPFKASSVMPNHQGDAKLHLASNARFSGATRPGNSVTLNHWQAVIQCDAK
jgi:hypothetical protein